ncbi:MAG: alanine racemase [Atopobiaceae bacterium]|jgi:alanine racemase|nr:alanine racemase [Atopobiaceae bacterium]
MPKRFYPETRWSWVEIDLGALRRNTSEFKKAMRPGVRMMAVVKADAYGHGAVRCAKVLHSSGADQFAVATVDEGVALREGGVEWPILILSEPPVDCVETLLRYDIMPTVYTEEFALAYGECASSMNKVGDYHLAIDTGMNRIGVKPVDLLQFRHFIDFHRGLRCAGTFTHFATADVLDDWDFALQANRFKEACKALHEAGYELGLVHCDNTPATVMHPELDFDMCRVGIGLYGLQPCELTAPRIHLDPVMSVRARVTRVVNPEVNEGVSYGFTYRVPKKNIQIATIPVGYADGLSRALSNRMEVIVNGARCRQVGRICMDQCMIAVDVNTARAINPTPPVEYGDLVTLIGRDGDDEITIDKMAEALGTINYEVACRFGMRLEKMYV